MPNFPRRDRLRAILGPDHDALLVSNPVNVRYLTGFTGGSSFLIVARNREMMVSDGRFTEQIAEEAPGLSAHIRSLAETTVEALGTVIGQLGLRNVGIESKHLTVGEFETLKEKVPSVNWASTKGLVEQLRAVKDDGEIKTIKRAIAVAESAYSEFRQQMQVADDEFDLTNRIEILIRKHDGQKSSFEPITAVGERSALAHAPATTRRLSSGQWLLLDWGAVVDGYHSDLTRILIPHTPPLRSTDSPRLDSDRLRLVYEAVLNAQQRAIAALRPGIAGKEIDAVARKSLEEDGFGEYFTHSLGHGLGLDVHEGPGLRANSADCLAAGNVVTVEPGVYFPGWGGIRIEDDVLVTPDGAEMLSHLPRELNSAYV